MNAESLFEEEENESIVDACMHVWHDQMNLSATGLENKKMGIFIPSVLKEIHILGFYFLCH